MYAIIETGGKQYRVKAGDVQKIETLHSSAGAKLVFDRVLFISGEQGTTVGSPYIAGARVEADVVEEGRAKKIIVQKFKSKVRYRRKKGHRQHFTKVKITAIQPK